jgi:hypothetical protein
MQNPKALTRNQGSGHPESISFFMKNIDWNERIASFSGALGGGPRFHK